MIGRATAAMTRRNSDSNIPPLAIRLFYLAAVAVSLPLLMWNTARRLRHRRRNSPVSAFSSDSSAVV